MGQTGVIIGILAVVGILLAILLYAQIYISVFRQTEKRRIQGWDKFLADLDDDLSSTAILLTKYGIEIPQNSPYHLEYRFTYSYARKRDDGEVEFVNSVDFLNGPKQILDTIEGLQVLSTWTLSYRRTQDCHWHLLKQYPEAALESCNIANSAWDYPTPAV